MARKPKMNPDRIARDAVQKNPPIPRQNMESVNTRREEGATRYNALIQKMLDIISESEGTDRLDFVPKKGRNIIKTPYDMVSNFGKNLLPKKSPTEMTIREVIDFGRPLVNATRKTTQSSAMGKYQIMANSYKRGDPKYEGNLEFFAKKLGLDIDNQLFTPEVQDQLAIAMLNDRVPSIKSFAFEATDKNLNKVLDELNATWRGVPDSKGKTSKGQNVGRLSVDDIKSTLNNLDMVEEQSETPSTDQQMSDLMNRMRDRNNRMDEQEVNAGDKSIESQSQQQRGVTEQSSELGFISPAEGATLSDIPPRVQTTRSGLAKRDPMKLREVTVDTGTKLEDRDGATEVEKSPGLDLPENAASDAFMRENFSIDEEELGIDAPKPGEIGFTADSAFDDIDPINEDDNMIYEEGNIGNEQMDDSNPLRSFFEGLFLDEPPTNDPDEVGNTEEYGDQFYNEPMDNIQSDPVETESNFDEKGDIATISLKEGGEVKADFDGKDEEEDEPADPPPLAKPKEVADDIPALLSEGEYVLPANVVRYLGVERIIAMHRRVLSEIQQMEDLGMIQNVDENGKPEQDDTEMKFAEEKEPEEGMTKGTIIIASSKPKGMMCPDPVTAFEGGFFETTDSYGDSYFDQPEPEPEPEPEPFDFGNDFAGDDLGSRPDDDPTVRDYERDSGFQFSQDVDPFTFDGEIDEEGRLLKNEFEKINEEAKKLDEEKRFTFTKQLDDIFKNTQGKGGLEGMVSKGVEPLVKGMYMRTMGALEQFNEFMEKKKAEAWSETKEAKIKEIEARENRPYDEAKDGAEVAVAQRAAFASQSGDPLEQMFAAGSTFVDNPTGNFSDEEWAAAAKQYSDYFNEGGQSDTNPIIDTIESLINKIRPKQEGKGVPTKSSSTLIDEETLQKRRENMMMPNPLGTIGAREGGGIMVKKKFSSGGTYVPGVGYRATVRPQRESDFVGANRTYEDIISGVLFEEKPDKKKRRILGRSLPIQGFRDKNIRGIPRDPYLKLDLNMYETDPEFQEEILRDFAAGRSRLGMLSGAASAKVTKDLTNYAIAKRQQYDGFLEGDMANLPKGATNRDALKTIFWKELSFDTTNRTMDVKDDPTPYGAYTAGGIGGPIMIYGKPRRPMEAKDFKKMWLTPFSEEDRVRNNNSKIGKLLDLDGPADIEKINRAQSYLTSEGNDRWINPDTNVPAGYIKNVFNEYRGFKGSPLRSGEKSDSMSNALMGKTYIEGVGYR
jgi:muramidase (phage lysozyme)